jgi:hypothetical protein
MDVHEVLLHIYCEGVSYSYGRGDDGFEARYGGPLEEKVSGVNFGNHGLHQVAVIGGGRTIEAIAREYAFAVPLIYGFRYDGCLLKYKFSPNLIEITEISPDASSDDWPYRNYPTILPYYSMRCIHREEKSWRAFAEDFPNLSEVQPAQLMAIALPPHSIGYSMWGWTGDAGGVSVVFECDLKEKMVCAYNICD